MGGATPSPHPFVGVRGFLGSGKDSEDAVVIGGGPAPSIAVACGEIDLSPGSDQDIPQAAILSPEESLPLDYLTAIGRKGQSEERRASERRDKKTSSL